MCDADMTPIFNAWSTNRRALMPMFDSVYTCRNFSSVQAWARHRSVGNVLDRNRVADQLLDEKHPH